MKKQDRNYRLLEYLNVNTRTSYLARIRNPNPKMPDAGKIAVASLEPEKRAPTRRATLRRPSTEAEREDDNSVETQSSDGQREQQLQT